ncbi:hypothetical protein RHOSPDRAFT_35550 [Rhodotorula sp. JG-1b]|nr:hypothetical protein RHOSPDRAFT_35550 [Rhodotorula sp. JG-1b]
MATATLLRPIADPAPPPTDSNSTSDSDDEGVTRDANLDPDDLLRCDVDDRRKRAAARRRRMYGGAACPLHDDEEEDSSLLAAGEEEPQRLLQTFELAGVVLAAHLSPLPLLAPYACATLSGSSSSPTFFILLLLLAGTISWLSSALVTPLQARYVGASSFSELAAAVLPHRRPAWLPKSGTTLASLFVLAGSLLRTTMGLVASAEIAVELVRRRVVGPHKGEDGTAWDRAVAVGIIGAVWTLFPFLWSPVLAVLGFRASGTTTTNPYTRLGTRSQADLVIDLDSPSASSSPLHEREWDWNESRGGLGSRGGGGGGETPTGPARPPRWSALLNLPAWSVAVLVWPIALALLGFRLRHLNRRHGHSPPLTLSSSSSSSLDSSEGDEAETRTTASVWWKAVLLTFMMMMGASHETFHYLTALKRSSPELAFKNTTTSRGRASSFFAAAEEEEEEAEEGGGGGEGVLDRPLQGGASSSGMRSERWRRRRRTQFPLAMALGLSGAFLVHLGWALVGTVGFAAAAAAASPSPEEEGPTTPQLGFPSAAFERVPPPRPPPPLLTSFRTRRIPTGNILSDPRLVLLLGTGGTDTDPYLMAVRLLVLFATLAQLEGHAHVGLACVRRFFLRAFCSFSTRRPPPSSSSSSHRMDDGGRGGQVVSRVVARTGFYALVVLSAWATIAWERPDGDGGRGTGLVRLAEWSGIGIAGIGGCLAPALTYLILFHLRKPRLILLSADPSAPEEEASHDELLERKEREMQRRLSGRRIWTDLGVFGVLGPVGVVLVARGWVAMIE